MSYEKDEYWFEADEDQDFDYVCEECGMHTSSGL